MLAYAQRFHGHNSVRYVYSNGQSVRGHGVTIKYIKNKRRTISRVTVVVSKKVVKSAVGRNRIRRRVYEFIRIQLPNIPSATDIAIIIGTPEVRTMPSADIEALFGGLLREAGLYKTS